jgi:hypothetical protein
MKLTLKTDDVTRSIARLQNAMRNAIPRAVTRGGTAAKTQLARDVAAATGMKVRGVQRRLRLTDATAANPRAVIDAWTVGVPLAELNARGRNPSRGRGAGITSSVGAFPHAFFARNRRGQLQVFARSGRPRLPIRQVRGPSVADAASRHLSAAMARGIDVMRARLQHEFQRLNGQ